MRSPLATVMLLAGRSEDTEAKGEGEDGVDKAETIRNRTKGKTKGKTRLGTGTMM